MRTKYRRTIDRNLELTRRLSNHEEALINSKLKSLTDEGIEELAKEINSGHPWEEEKCINRTDMSYCALAAVQSELIKPTQFASLMLYWSTIQSKDFIKSHRLFKGNEIDSSSFQLLKKTHLDALDLSLMEEEYKEFFKRMRELPVSEQQFFEISNQDKDTILNALAESEFNVFGRIDGTKRIIPSVGMMQVYLDVKFKSNAVKINPVIGLSSLEDIRKNGLKSERDVKFPFPGLSLPLADGYSAEDYRFPIHDFYHSTIASCAPAKEREFIISTSDTIKNYLDDRRQLPLVELKFYPKEIVKIIYQYWEPDLTPEETTINSLINMFIDMELNMYRPDNQALAIKGADLEVMYWVTILSIFSKLFLLAIKLTPLSTKTFEEILSKLFEFAVKNK